MKLWRMIEQTRMSRLLNSFTPQEILDEEKCKNYAQIKILLKIGFLSQWLFSCIHILQNSKFKMPEKFIIVKAKFSHTKHFLFLNNINSFFTLSYYNSVSVCEILKKNENSSYIEFWDVSRCEYIFLFFIQFFFLLCLSKCIYLHKEEYQFSFYPFRFLPKIFIVFVLSHFSLKIPNFTFSFV